MPARTSAVRQVATAAGLAAAVICAALPAAAAPTANAVALRAAAPAASTTSAAVTVRPDPASTGGAFEGWGASLVWSAHATGTYPDEIRNKLADLVFGPDGLNLNIARYNIGGGNAPDVRKYMRVGSDVPGWWKAPAGTTRNDKDWWNPDDPADWNWDADPGQRWWVDKIKDRITHWETFSNSPPYFQTVSGYVSGGTNPGVDQIRADKVDDFATYLVRVTRHLETAHGIKVDTIDPLNEPNTTYWGTTLDAQGLPTGGRQEGAHAGPALQQAVVKAVAARLAKEGRSTKVSAMDETNPGTFLTDWNAYDADARAAVSRLNVHTYGTSQRTAVRDAAKGGDKPLWMSEVEGTWGTGESFTSMLPGLGIAQRIVDDLRELEPTAWVLWQPIENGTLTKPSSTSAGSNWGEIHVPFECTASDTPATCPIRTNTKFDTIRNFTHYVRPGDHLLKTGDVNSVAALSPKNALTVVYVNNATSPTSVKLDLSAFARVAAGTTVTPVTSSESGALVTGTPVAVTDAAATLQVPAQSVTTFVVNGKTAPGDVSKAPVQKGHAYRLRGVVSGRSLTPSAASGSSGLVLRTDDPVAASQLWTLRSLGDATSDRSRYVVATAAGDRLLALVNGTLTAAPVADVTATPDASAQWILSTTGDGTYTLVNVATGRLVDVSGGATADGSTVTTYQPTAGSNQLWRLVDETVLGVQPATVFATPGTAPTLPATVVPVYRDGPRGTLPVTWTVPAGTSWGRGKVTLAGVATDRLGGTHPATATVVVDAISTAEPGRAKTYTGGAPTLPATVTAVTKRGYQIDRPVTWDPVPPSAYASPGVVTVTGRADAGGGATVPATARLQVTEPVLVNAALASGTLAEATYTESGYSAAGLVNGNTTDKAWSNWKSGTKNASDTLTVTLPAARDLAKTVIRFYRDGRDSYAQTLTVQVRGDNGSWTNEATNVAVPAGSPAPAVETAVPAGTGPVGAVRYVLNAYPNGYITASEIQVYARTSGRSADATAASIALDGVALPGFSPQVTQYTAAAGSALPAVTAVPTDPYATVTITQPTSADRTATVAVTSEDATSTRTYRVVLG